VYKKEGELSSTLSKAAEAKEERKKEGGEQDRCKAQGAKCVSMSVETKPEIRGTITLPKKSGTRKNRWYNPKKTVAKQKQQPRKRECAGSI